MIYGGTDVPIRIRGGVVHIHIERTTIRNCVVRIAPAIRETQADRALYPYISKN